MLFLLLTKKSKICTFIISLENKKTELYNIILRYNYLSLSRI